MTFFKRLQHVYDFGQWACDLEWPFASISCLVTMVYLYDDLKTGERVEIRLVTLEGTNEVTGELICRLDTVRLSGALEYRALSYCWGDASKQSTIICNGHRLPATPNLVAALRCLFSKARRIICLLPFGWTATASTRETTKRKKSRSCLWVIFIVKLCRFSCGWDQRVTVVTWHLKCVTGYGARGPEFIMFLARNQV